MKKSNVRMKPMCSCTWAFLSIKQPHFLSLVFSLFWGENFLVDPKRKHLNLTIYFSSFSPNQTHFKKVFIPIFSPKFFIHSTSPLNKYNLSRKILDGFLGDVLVGHGLLWHYDLHSLGRKFFG